MRKKPGFPAIEEVFTEEYLEKQLKRFHNEDAQIHRHIEYYEEALEKLRKKLKRKRKTKR